VCEQCAVEEFQIENFSNYRADDGFSKITWHNDNILSKIYRGRDKRYKDKNNFTINLMVCTFVKLNF
jgi:hypothetical protein